MGLMRVLRERRQPVQARQRGKHRKGRQKQGAKNNKKQYGKIQPLRGRTLPYCKYAQRAATYAAARCQSRKLPSSAGAFFCRPENGCLFNDNAQQSHFRAVTEQFYLETALADAEANARPESVSAVYLCGYAPGRAS